MNLCLPLLYLLSDFSMSFTTINTFFNFTSFIPLIINTNSLKATGDIVPGLTPGYFLHLRITDLNPQPVRG